MKRCSKCGETKSVDQFYKEKRNSNGLCSQCKACQVKHKKSLNFSVDPNLKEKKCSKCDKTKSPDEFYKEKRYSNGLTSQCKACQSKYAKSRNCSVDPNLKEKKCSRCDKIKSPDEFGKEKKNSSGLKAHCKACQVKYKKSLNFSVDPNLKEKKCSKCGETKSPDEFSKSKVDSDGLQFWCKDCRLKYQRKRYQTDPLYKLKMTVRNHMRRIVESTKLKKEKRSFEYLGCTISEFKEHIESQFVEGMSWDNYAWDKWHIDHKIPLDWYVKNADDPFKANHYDNLQPMWAKDNMSKGAKYESEEH